MKIYISLPMTGYTKTVNKRYYNAYEELIKKYGKDITIVGPTNVDEFDENGLNPEAPIHSWSWHMGEDVKVLLECDAIYMCRGWFASEGCRIELAVARMKGIEVVKQENADTFLDPVLADNFDPRMLAFA